MPAPIEKGFHKGFYTREQVDELTKEINKAREQTRSMEQGREVKSFDERLEQASKRANENVKDKILVLIVLFLLNSFRDLIELVLQGLCFYLLLPHLKSLIRRN